MGSSGTDHIPCGDGAVEAETTIEIKIKTLDAQTYTLRVDKQMPVPALKEQIASVTGVLSDQQRLICRGKVLKDDQLLSAYHVEDGHTLHMVVRQPIPPSSDGLPNHPGIDPGSTSRHTHQLAPGIVIETFSLPGQADGGAPPPEISRILSAVLGSMGISGLGSSVEGMENRENASQSEQTSSRTSSGFSMGGLQPPVIPDSLATLTQFISNIRREFEAIVTGREGASRGQVGPSEERNFQSAATGSRQGFPTPASLAEVIVSARHLLTNQAAEALLQLERQLEDQASVTDPSARSSTQSSAMRTGALVHNLGSFLLELGRTIMTLRMGQSPSEAVVNAGPAIFISPNGPNPIMVQPLPFQVGASFGSIPMGAVQSGSGLVNGAGAAYVPRRIDIQIRRGSPGALANANREEQANAQQPSGQRNPTTSPGGSENPSNHGASLGSDVSGFSSDSGVRMVPLRTVVASVPGSYARASSDPPGLSEAPNPRPTEQTISSRSVSINILSAGGLPNTGDSDRQLPGGVMQFIRNFFPGGEIHVEEGTSEGVATGDNQAVPPSGAEAGPEPEPMPSEEGVFLSNLLRQIMPMIPGQVGSESEAEPANASEVDNTDAGSSRQAGSSSAGGSRRPDGSESGSPNSKRQKTE